MTGSKPSSGPTPVQSLGRSLDLLEALGDEELGLVAIAKRTGLGASTAYRLLSTLMSRGYVTRSAQTGEFRLGAKVIELAAAARRGSESLRTAIHPHLRALRDMTGETANLVVPDDDAVVYVDQVEGIRAVRMFTAVGRRVPLHASAGGKAIASSWSPDAIEAVVAPHLEGFTANTIATPEELNDELVRARDRGYSIDDEEFEVGVVCVAAPVFGVGGLAVGAVSVSGPAQRMREHGLSELGELLRKRAAQASRELGAQSVAS